MFINYFRDTERESLLNLLVARTVLGVYGIWKLSTINWQEIYQLDTAIIAIYSQIALPDFMLYTALLVLPATAFCTLFLFLIGYRVKWASLLSGLSIGLLTALLSFPRIYYSLSTLSHLLLIYSVFSADDKYSFEKISQFSFSKIFTLSKAAGKLYQVRFLKWMLVYLSLTYFITAANRLLSGGLTAWLNTDALPRTIRYTLELQGKSLNSLAEIIISEPLLIIIGILVVLVAEVGFLIAVLSKKPIDFFVVAIIILHILFAVVLNLYAFNQLVLIGLLLPWDTIYERISNFLKKELYGLAGI